jgi:amino acid permease
VDKAEQETKNRTGLVPVRRYTTVNSGQELVLLIVLYLLFSYIGTIIFGNMMSILVAGIIAALVGLVISLLVKGKKA